MMARATRVAERIGTIVLYGRGERRWQDEIEAPLPHALEAG
jgi:hypothetical protein